MINTSNSRDNNNSNREQVPLQDIIFIENTGFAEFIEEVGISGTLELMYELINCIETIYLESKDKTKYASITTYTMNDRTTFVYLFNYNKNFFMMTTDIDAKNINDVIVILKKSFYDDIEPNHKDLIIYERL